MRKNKQSTRSLVALLVTWSFLVLMVTGIVLYIVPQGRVAYWVHWSLAGMEKDQWGWGHMMFGGVFMVTGILHLYYNWKPFKKYLADRVMDHVELKREVFVATGLTVIIFILSVLNIPPASWVIDLNTWVKDSWVSSPDLEPPFGHAEEVSLAGLSRRMDLDLDMALVELEANEFAFNDKRDSLEAIARANGTTPMAIYALIRNHRITPAMDEEPLSPEAIEAKYAGTGLGIKSLAEICGTVGIDLEVGLKRLSLSGISATGENTARDVAQKSGLNPIDILKIMMLKSSNRTQ